MKLLLKFNGFGEYEKFLVVDWGKSPSEFPVFSKWDNKYWGAQFYDKDVTGQADQVMYMSEYKATAIPTDMFGNKFPVTDIDLMFNVKNENNLSAIPCECGSDSAGLARHSSWCPKVSQ